MRTWWLPFTIACGLDPALGLDTGSGANAVCEQRLFTECELDTVCVTLDGRPLLRSSRGYCHDPTIPVEPLGCGGAGVDCGFAQAFARDRAGDLWWFPNRCLPPGFTLLTDGTPPDCDN